MEKTVKAKTGPTTALEFRRNPYVFVVGCPRSGTTLLQRMLDHHPSLALVDELHFVPKLVRRAKANSPLTAEIVEKMRKHRYIRRLDVSDDDIREAEAAVDTYADFVTELFSRHGKARGKPLVGEKTPHYVAYIPVLNALFPHVRFVHIVRDGRDVALSLLEWNRWLGKLEPWKDEPVGCAALLWKNMIEDGRRDGKELGSFRYYQVSYENLVADPEATLRLLTDFLDLPYASEMTTYHAGKARQKPGRSAKKAWLPPTTGLRNWRTEMKERDIELFEALAGDVLSELGYDRSTTCISSEVAEAATRCRSWWQAEQEHKGGKRKRLWQTARGDSRATGRSS